MPAKNRVVDDLSLLESVVKESPSRQKTWIQAHLSTWKVGAMGTYIPGILVAALDSYWRLHSEIMLCT